MLVDYHVKTPTNTITVEFDFREFVAAVAPDAVNFVGKADIGPTYVEKSNVDGLITLEISGGTLGRHYLFGYEATTDAGEAVTMTRRLRIRESTALDGIPVVLDLALLTEDGDTLVTENGDVLAFA